MNQANVLDKVLVICLGEALVDRLGPPGGDPNFDKPVEDRFGGAPANVACALARLGNKVAFVGCLGQDKFGKDFRALMASRDINLDCLQFDFKHPTRIVLVKREFDGERIFQGFAGHEGIAFADQVLDLSLLTNQWELLSKESEWLVIGTIPLASKQSAETINWVVQNANNKGVKIAIDLNWRPTFWSDKLFPDSGPEMEIKTLIKDFLKKASLIKLAKEEAIWFFNTCDPEEIAKTLSNKTNVVVTDGPRLISWFIEGLKGEMPANIPIKVVDTTGAGDCFMAGLIHQFLEHRESNLNEKQIKRIIKFAACCGAYVCQSSGAIDPQPTKEEIQEFMESAIGEYN